MSSDFHVLTEITVPSGADRTVGGWGGGGAQPATTSSGLEGGNERREHGGPGDPRASARSGNQRNQENQGRERSGKGEIESKKARARSLWMSGVHISGSLW